MPATKELRRRLSSVRNTRKITYAMKLVSAAKLRKAQESVTRSRDYTSALNRLLLELADEFQSSDFSHPLLQKRSATKRVRYIVVGGSRGLCGGYNANVNKRMDAIVRERTSEGVSIDWVLVGRKPAESFRRLGRAYSKSYETLPEDANLWPIDELAQEAEEAFLSGVVDEVHVVFTRFKSALSMVVTNDKLLPIESSELGVGAKAGLADTRSSAPTLFEPSAEELLASLLPRVIRSKIRQAALDAKASEYSSRMTAMDSATKNAGELAKKLELKYNKVRQSSITAELLDILGGAEAIK